MVATGAARVYTPEDFGLSEIARNVVELADRAEIAAQ